MPKSGPPRLGNNHYAPESDSEEDFGTYSRRAQGGHDPPSPGSELEEDYGAHSNHPRSNHGPYLGSEGEGGDDDYYHQSGSHQRQLGYSGSSAGAIAPERNRRRGHNGHFDGGAHQSARPGRGQRHQHPLFDIEQDEQENFDNEGARNRRRPDHDPVRARPDHSFVDPSHRGSGSDFGSDSGHDGDGATGNNAWGPPDEGSASFADSDGSANGYDEQSAPPRGTRRRPDHGMQSSNGRSRHHRQQRSPLPSPAPAPNRGSERPSTRGPKGGRHPASNTDSSNRHESPPPRFKSYDSGGDSEDLSGPTGTDSDDELRKIIELSRQAGEEHFLKQQREQDEQIERLMQQSKEEAHALEAKKQKRHQRLMEEQQRQEDEAKEASRAIAEAEDQKRAKKENAFLEESRKEAQALQRERERKQIEEVEKENAFVEESRRDAEERERKRERRQMKEAEEENGILEANRQEFEASRREMEAKEEEELAAILEQSRLEAENDRRRGGIAIAQFATRQATGNFAASPAPTPSASTAPARDKPTSVPRARSLPVHSPPVPTSTPPTTAPGAADDDMASILAEIAALEARQAAAEAALNGASARTTSASQTGPRTAAEIEAENEAALRAALAQSLGDEGAPKKDPDEGDENPPPTYGEAVEGIDGGAVLVEDGEGGGRRRKHRRHRERHEGQSTEEPVE